MRKNEQKREKTSKTNHRKIIDALLHEKHKFYFYDIISAKRGRGNA